MAQSSLASAADYADALLTARRAKNWLFLLVLLTLILQLALFFILRYTSLVDVQVSEPVGRNRVLQSVFHYMVNVCDFLGVALAIVLNLTLLLIVNIMLVGRTIGVGRVTSAYVWSIVLAVLLFPWQAFFISASPAGQEWAIPGVLYTWNELVDGYAFRAQSIFEAILKWARFVGFPLVAVALLLYIQARSSRGLRSALGESDTDLDSLGHEG